MPSPIVIKNRYEIGKVLGRGGMGVVYQAFDTLMRRDVALKTLREIPDTVLVELFYRECTVLAGMVHPNVIEIFDMGEFTDDDGVAKPYFVMPLLPGSTLHDLLYPAGIPVPLNRGVEIIYQASRGLQAAHERGLLHRDIKPRNIFVMKDDAVKLIDFGVAHLLGSNSTSMRGTPQYMSPEQITFRPLKAQSDVFSMATVCYEALTAVHPFLRNSERRDSDAEIAAAITTYTPPLASDVNPSVSRNVAQVVAKGMGKDPLARFESAAAFADALQRALRNERFSGSNSAGVQIRVSRARRSLEQNDHQFASEIIGELEAEGHSDAEIRQLRGELDEAIRKDRTDRLIEAAQRCFASEEFTLALRKVQELLEIDPANPAGIQLRKQIEELLTQQKVVDLLRAATEHIENAAFTNARQALQDALKLRPNDTRARQLLSEVEARQKELLRQRQEQERLYQSAHASWLAGKIDAALANLDELANLTRASEPRERINEYQEFHRRVRVEHAAVMSSLEQGRRLLAEGDFTGAQRITDRYLRKYSEHHDFVELARQIDQAREEDAAAYRRNVADRLAAEPRLETQAEILQSAIEARPAEIFFQDELRRVRERLSEVEAVAAKARDFEKQQAFEKALRQWEALAEIYPDYPDLQAHIEKASAAWLAQRAKAKANWLAQVNAVLEQEDAAKSLRLLVEAERELPGDGDLAALRSRAEDLSARASKVSSLLEQARKAAAARHFDVSRSPLTEAAELSRGFHKLTRSVFDGFVEVSTAALSTNWRLTKELLEQAAEFDKSASPPARLWEQIRRQERESLLTAELENAAAQVEAGRLAEARESVEGAIRTYGEDPRLKTRLRSIDQAIAEKLWREDRENRFRRLGKLARELEATEDPAKAPDLLAQTKTVVGSFAGDEEFSPIARAIVDQVSASAKASAALSREDFRECLDISERMLTRYPGHKLFIGLKSHAEFREREKAADYLETVERQLATEPDLEKRSKILEVAIRAYPTEPFYSEELSLVRGKQELVKGTADRARAFEKQGWYPEALERWQYLKTVYPIFPGLDESIARATQLWGQKREAARKQYIDAIEEALKKHEYSRALEDWKKADAEFPDDAALSALSERAFEGRSRQSQAENLLDEAVQDLNESDFESGQRKLSEAVGIAPDRTPVAAAAAGYLLHFARHAVKTNLDRAESMISDASSLDPNVEITEELRHLIAEAHRIRDFGACHGAVRVAEERGDLPGALHSVRLFLEKYPGEPQAEDLERRLLDTMEEARRAHQKARDLDELKALEDQALTATHHENILDILKRSQQIARNNSYDRDVTVAADHLGGILSAMAELRSLMKVGDLDQAEKLCAGSGKRFPGYSGFPELDREIQIRQREKAAAYLHDVERKLVNEHDFSEQARILEEAVRRFPNESYFAEELNLVHNKQSFLVAEIARVRQFESKELFEDAIREWEALRSRYPWNSSFEAEIQRVSKVWKLKNEELTKSWIARIGEPLNAGDYEAAAKLLDQASGDLPGEPRILQLAQTLADLRQKQVRAGESITKGRSLLRGGSVTEGFASLAEAARAMPLDRKLRSSIHEILVTHKDAWLSENWRDAEMLLAGLPPGEDAPLAVSRAIADKKSEAELVELLQQADQKEAQGNYSDALRTIESLADRFPNDPRITGRRVTLQAAMRRIEAERARAEALAAIVSLRSRLGATTKKSRVNQLKAQSESGPLARPDDPEVRAAALALALDFQTRLQALESVKPKVPLSRWLLIAAAAVPVVALVFWFTSSARAYKAVQVSVVPEGVLVLVDGKTCVTPNCKLQLPTGEHKVQLTKAGYTPRSITLSIDKQTAQPIPLEAALDPLPPVATQAPRVVTPPVVPKSREPEQPAEAKPPSPAPALPKPALMSIRGAAPGTTVKIDGGAPAITSGKALTSQVPPGVHTVEVTRDGFLPKRFSRRFVQGETLVLTQSELTLSPVPPDAAALEAQDWKKVSDAATAASLQDYLRRYPAGLHAAAAGSKLEQMDWNSLDKQNAPALRAFIARHPGGQFTDGAQRALDTIAQAEKVRAEQTDWSATDKTSSNALASFLSKYPNGPHAASAQGMLTALNKKTEEAPLQPVQPPKPPRAKPVETLNPEAPAIVATIQNLASAWNGKNVDGIIAIQPNLNKRMIRGQLESLRAMQMTIRALAPPQINGDRATILCDREVAQTFSDGTHKTAHSTVTFALSKRNGVWIIDGVT